MTTPPFLRIISMVCLSDLIGRAAQENMQMNDTRASHSFALLCSALQKWELCTSHKTGLNHATILLKIMPAAQETITNTHTQLKLSWKSKGNLY